MVYLLLGTGFEETELIAPLDLLRRAGVEAKTVGINGKIVYGSHGIGVEADISLAELDHRDLEMIILPGGSGGVASVRASDAAMAALDRAWKVGKFVAAICAGPKKRSAGSTKTAAMRRIPAPGPRCWAVWASPTASAPPATPAARPAWEVRI